MTTAPKFRLYPTIENISVPERKSEGAAGYDVYSPFDFQIDPNSSVKINLGFKIELPENILINLYMRSGLALKQQLEVVGKRIYGSLEDIYVEIRNNSCNTYNAKKGDRIAQMVFHEVFTPHNS